MKKTCFSIICLTLSFVMIFSLAACGKAEESTTDTAPSTEAAAPAETSAAEPVTDVGEITLVLGDTSTSGNFTNKQVLYFADQVSELSGGKMKIDVFADSLLGTESAMLSNIQSGGLQMGAFYSTFSSIVPKASLFDLPFLISDRSQLQTLVDVGLFDEIDKQASEVNVKLLTIGENGFRHITNNVRPIVEPDDLKGIVIRTPSNSLRVAMFEALGASPTALAWSECYQALESGVCDGQENPFAQIGGAQLYNVQKYLSLSGHIYTPMWLTVNLDTWKSLSEAQQNILLKAGKKMMNYAWETGAEYDDEQLQVCKDNKMEVNEVNVEAFRKALLPLWDKFADEVGGAEFVASAKTALGY